MSVFMIFFAVLYYALVLGLVISRLRKQHTIGVLLKTFLGLMFTGLAVYGSVNGKNHGEIAFFVTIVLLFNLIGDIYLALCKLDRNHSTLYFLTALGIIGTGHLVLLHTLGTYECFHYMYLFLAFVGPIVNLCIMFLKRIQVEKTHVLVLCYSYVVYLVAILALFTLLNVEGIKLLCFGIIVYWLSDVVLFFVKYIYPNIVLLDGINKFLYYSAQLLISISILYMGRLKNDFKFY